MENPISLAERMIGGGPLMAAEKRWLERLRAAEHLSFVARKSVVLWREGAHVFPETDGVSHTPAVYPGVGDFMLEPGQRLVLGPLVNVQNCTVRHPVFPVIGGTPELESYVLALDQATQNGRLIIGAQYQELL